MANKSFIAFFFFILWVFSLTTQAANELRYFDGSIGIEDCNAPAPTNFRVENYNQNFVRLAWNPWYPGATHTLTVLENLGGGNWDTLYTVPNIPGNTYDVYGLQMNVPYRFVIATNCGDGTPSSLTSEVDFIGLILDLTLSGRTPIDPQPVEGNCPEINFYDHHWVGFKVERLAAPGVSSSSEYFQFVEGADGQPVIKRVREQTVIVAGDEFYVYPKIPEPQIVKIGAEYRFFMYFLKSIGLPHTIGQISVTYSSGALKICKKTGEIWDSQFQFTFLTATSSSGLFEDDPERSSKIKQTGSEPIFYPNPFSDEIELRYPSVFQDGNHHSVVIELFDATGKLVRVLNITQNGQSPDIRIPTEFILPGLYVVKSNINGALKAHKLLKL